LTTEPFSPAAFVSPIRAIRALKSPTAVDRGIGEPLDCWPDGFSDEVARVAAAAIGRGGMPYLAHVGHGALRQHLARELGTDNVLVTNGAQGALAASIIAMVQPGDRVVVPDPGFVAYPHLVRWAGGEPVPVDARASVRGLDLDALERALKDGARGLVLGQPSNPTGLALATDDLAHAMQLLAAHGAWLVCDVVYALLPMAWEAIPVPLFKTADDAPRRRAADRASVLVPPGLSVAIVSSTAKAWCAPGLRVGWLASNWATWAERSTRVHSLFNTHASSLGQEVALYLLQSLSTSQIAATLRRRGELALETLRPALPDLALAPGSFYLWVPLPGGRDDAEFVKAAAVKPDGVALIPGSAFGVHGRGHIRLSHGVQPEQVAEGSRRLARELERLR
jgi:aspartate/methionine/tyrosine aminotransferase